MNYTTYFVQATSGGPIKIGLTQNCPFRRLSELQTGSPTRLQIVGMVEGNRERELHMRFDRQRLHGEWFRESKELIGFIRSEASHIQASKRMSEASHIQARERRIGVVRSSELITFGEVAKLLNVSVDHVKKLCSAGELESVPSVSDEALKRFIEKRTIGPKARRPRRRRSEAAKAKSFIQ